MGSCFRITEAVARAAEDPSFDPAEIAVTAPDDHWEQFSYASEHVSHDAAISALLACEQGLRRAGELLEGHWEAPLRWIDERLSEIWTMRGPYPGLGPALCAFGLEHGNLLAYELAKRLQPNDDPWTLVDKERYSQGPWMGS